MAESDEIEPLIDFGTNVELVLNPLKGIYACATAAGPAFEGARIEHGMRVSPGAIDRVWIDNGRFHVRTIDDLPPAGIAGTGLVSAIAALRLAGMIDNSGDITQLECNLARVSNKWCWSNHSFSLHRHS